MDLLAAHSSYSRSRWCAAKSQSSFSFFPVRRKALKLRPVVVAMAREEGNAKSNALQSTQAHTKLKIGMLGFGNFGQFLANTMIKQGHSIIATSRSDYTQICQKMGIQFFRDPHDFCEEHPEVILLSTSILSAEETMRALPLHRLKRNTLFVDVLSVKEFPRKLLLQVLPQECGILCTHPMFGPESGKETWASLPFVYDKVRPGLSPQKCKDFLKIFETEGCSMVEMSCAEHDRHAAESQFITHTVGRILSHLNLESTPINTKGYETLLDLTNNTVSDSFDLYYGLFMYNVNATEQIDKLDHAFEAVKQELYGRLHHVLWKQLLQKLPEPLSKPNIENVTKRKYLPPNLKDSPASFVSTEVIWQSMQESSASGQLAGSNSHPC